MENANQWRRMWIGFGGQAVVAATPFRRQRLIEAQCKRTGQSEADTEKALLEMTPSDLALMELTGSPDTPGVHEFEYDPTQER
jgi:hypothetical protein